MAQKTRALVGRAEKATGVLAGLAILSLTFSIFTPSSQAHAAGCPTPTAPTEGDGSSDAPWVIDSAAKLAWIGEAVGSSDADRVDPSDNTSAFKQHAARLAAHYVQEGRIDLSGCDWRPIGFVWAACCTDGVPIEYARPFSGTYDGQDNVIAGLTVDTPSGFRMQSGLFGAVGSDDSESPAIVKNIVIDAANVQSFFTDNNQGPSGVLAGILGVTVSPFSFEHAFAENVHVSGSVSKPLLGHRIGGLVGLVGGSAVVRDSSSTATVSRVREDGTTGVGDRTGGLIGELESGGTVLKSYATGDVTTGNTDGLGRTGSHVGGLVGQNRGTILYSYSTGNIIGDSQVGGLVGSLFSDSQQIKSSYSTGNVFGASNNLRAGGFVGEVRRTPEENRLERNYSSGSVTTAGRDDGSRIGAFGGSNFGSIQALSLFDNVEHNFFDSSKDVPSLAIAITDPDGVSGVVTGRSTVELNSFATFDEAGWAIVDGWEPFDAPDTGLVDPEIHKVWGICSGVNGGYPFLLWQFDSDPCVVSAGGVTGSNTSPEKRSSDAGIHLDFQASVGDLVAGSSVVIGGQGLAGGSQYSLVVRSTPQTLASGASSALGNFSGRVSMPALSAGSHTLTLTATALDGSTLTLVQSFTVAANGTISAIGSPTGSQTGGLAATGVSGLVGGLGLAGLALLLGVAMVLSARRYQHTD